MRALASPSVRVHVAFTPADVSSTPTVIVVDVLRATSTIAQALAAGYERVLCCAEIDDARSLRQSRGEGALAGERECVRIPGFDLGNSPADFIEPIAESVILTTTNGTRALIAASSAAERVFAASLLNLDAIVSHVRRLGNDVTILCAGVLGEFAMDDAYCAGRIVELIDGDSTDGAQAALRLARSFETAEHGLAASQSARNLLAANLADDVAWCARESVLDVVPHIAQIQDAAVDVTVG